MPRPLRRHLPGQTVRTMRDCGWLGKKNGELLALMAADGFEVLLTVDQSLRYQQNLSIHGIAVIVVVASSNRMTDLTPLIPGVTAALASVQPGDVVEVRI